MPWMLHCRHGVDADRIHRLGFHGGRRHIEATTSGVGDEVPRIFLGMAPPSRDCGRSQREQSPVDFQAGLSSCLPGA